VPECRPAGVISKEELRSECGVKFWQSFRGVMVMLILCLFAAVVADTVPMASADDPSPATVVRLADLDIDPGFVEQYRAALAEEIRTSIDVEPGVLTLYAVSIKGDPTRIRIFETYADMDAYRSHVASPHFLKYKNETQHMIRNLTLLETDPILLGARP
jgi:quinol monooxygenase YgiN